jgi:hypothetical protein
MTSDQKQRAESDCPGSGSYEGRIYTLAAVFLVVVALVVGDPKYTYIWTGPVSIPGTVQCYNVGLKHPGNQYCIESCISRVGTQCDEVFERFYHQNSNSSVYSVCDANSALSHRMQFIRDCVQHRASLNCCRPCFYSTDMI